MRQSTAVQSKIKLNGSLSPSGELTHQTQTGPQAIAGTKAGTSRYPDANTNLLSPAGREEEPSHIHTLVSGTVLAFSYSTAEGSSIPQSPHLYQSSPISSAGCCVRSEPLPQLSESAEQYLSHPQQIRSGCFGFSGIFLIISSFQKNKAGCSAHPGLPSSRGRVRTGQ